MINNRIKLPNSITKVKKEIYKLHSQNLESCTKKALTKFYKLLPYGDGPGINWAWRLGKAQSTIRNKSGILINKGDFTIIQWKTKANKSGRSYTQYYIFYSPIQNTYHKTKYENFVDIEDEFKSEFRKTKEFKKQLRQKI